MRCWQTAALAASLIGCNGIAIGGSEGSESVPCPNTDQPIGDPSVPAPGFDRSADDLLAAASGRFEGRLRVRDGETVPLSIDMRVLRDTVHAAAPERPSQNCPNYVWADIELDVDAGAWLKGVAAGSIDSREPQQIRATGTELEAFETRFTPEFRAEVLHGPWLQIYLLLDGAKATWNGELNATGHIRAEPCDEKTEMCTGTPGGFDVQHVDLAELTVRAVE